MTVAEWLGWGRQRLGGDGGLIDAEALLSFVTGKPVAALIADAAHPVPEGQGGDFRALVERRARGEPVAYLSGQKAFWSLPLVVTPEVLIPRPESELLVAEVLANATDGGVASLLELGTGSGAIALALARELPRCAIIATDISPGALGVARRNRAALACGNVGFRAGAWFDAVAAQRFDCIVANPPYIAPGDPHLGRGDLRFEPTLALVSPADGLADLQRIIVGAPQYLNPGGMLFVEHGWDQASAVRDLMKQNRFTSLATRRDLAGHPRVSGGRIRGGAGIGRG